MAAAIPSKLKTADVQRFATRAAQLEKFRPIVSYWCEYHILQTILQNHLHIGDEECQNYALQLMDKLETFKSANITNDAIVDDLAAKAYVENFALDTFNRADETQRANKVTRQTADTFQAAATFLDLLGIWGEVEKEVKDKSRFAKFHAVRIAKAMKAGEDPNEGNPVVEEVPAPQQQTEDEGIDAELKGMERQENGTGDGVYKPAPVAQDDVHDVSPIEPADGGNDGRQGSLGGGYFPSLPDAPATSATPSEDTNMLDFNPSSSKTRTPPPQDISSPSQFYTDPPQPPHPAPAPTPDSLEIAPSPRPRQPPPDLSTARPPAVVPIQPPPVPAAPVSQVLPKGGYKTDDEAVLRAQKHAKWAISALNFEDVTTAVKELKLALQTLGAG